MIEEKKKARFIVPYVIITALATLLTTLLGVYFTDVFFKPKLLYSSDYYDIEIPEEYREEIIKKDVESMMEGLSNALQDNTFNDYKLEAGVKPKIVDQKGRMENYLIFQKGGNKLNREALVKLMGVINDKNLIKKVFGKKKWYPDAVINVRIMNKGNREANDVNINITTNGVITKYELSSDEPTVKDATLLTDQEIGLPVGVSIGNIKRIVPDGFITLKMYVQIIEPYKDNRRPSPTITIVGTHSKGKIEYARP